MFTTIREPVLVAPTRVCILQANLGSHTRRPLMRDYLLKHLDVDPRMLPIAWIQREIAGALRVWVIADSHAPPLSLLRGVMGRRFF